MNFKAVVTAKMQAYLGESRMPLKSMFHVGPSNLNAVMLNPSFISVGEWVEVDADRMPGYNSEGGIAVVVAVADALFDVKYCDGLAKDPTHLPWVEQYIAHFRNIVMPRYSSLFANEVCIRFVVKRVFNICLT